MIALGVDLGSRAYKWALLDGSRIVDLGIQETLPGAMEELLRRLPPAEVVGGTGYGRRALKERLPSARVGTEIAAHGAAAAALAPGAARLLDIGGQDSKAMTLDGAGRVLDFRLNDRCAAGTGRFLENMARAMGIPVEEIGELAARAERPVPVSSLCAVFAESEVVSLLASGSSPAGVARGIFASLGTRVAALFSPLAPTGPAALSGGVAEISGAAELLSLYSGIFLKPLPHPRFAGAIGAARIAAASLAPTKPRGDRIPSPGDSPRIPADRDGAGRGPREEPR